MRNRVKVVETTYHIDKVNKVVICTLKCDMQLEKHPSWNYTASEMFRKHLPNVSWDGRFKVKAKAKCNANDVFDEVLGKRIAESRAKSKMFDVARRVYSCLYTALSTTLLDIVQSCIDSAEACTTAVYKEEAHILNLIE